MAVKAGPHLTSFRVVPVGRQPFLGHGGIPGFELLPFAARRRLDAQRTEAFRPRRLDEAGKVLAVADRHARPDVRQLRISRRPVPDLGAEQQQPG